MHDEDDPLLSATEAAELIGLTRADSWRSRASRKKIPPDTYVDGRTPRWRQSTVEASGAFREGQGHRSDLARSLYGTPSDAPEIPETMRPWTTSWPAYNALAVDITPTDLRPGEGLDQSAAEWGAEPYATPTDIPGREWAERLSAAVVPYILDSSGWPLHPLGRTGKKGRDLRCWGENCAADAIVIAGRGKDTSILLVRRRDRAEQGQSEWALPGGHIDAGETALTAALRELHEETGADLHEPETVEEDPTLIYRGVVPDPRETDHAWMTSTAFLFLITEQLDVSGNDDALEARWFPASNRETLNAALAAANSHLYTAHEPIVNALYAHLSEPTNPELAHTGGTTS